MSSLPRERQWKISCVLLLLPVLATASGLYLSKTNNSIPLMIVLVIISVSPTILFRLDGGALETGLYGVSLALLFQNTMIHRNLLGGDAGHEYYLANIVFHHGWDPNAAIAHNNLIRLTIGHPIFAKVTGMDLIWSFKLAHPIIIAIIPLVLYKISKIYFNKYVSLSSALTYIFLHPYFTRLARDTRTGTAMLLFAVLVLCVLKFRHKMRGEKGYHLTVLILGLGLIFAHEGTAILGLGMILLTITVEQFFNPRPRDVILFTIVGIMMYLVYTLTVDGKMFVTVVSVVYEVTTQISSFGLSSGSAASSAATATLESITYEVIRFEFIIIFGLAGFGYLFLLYDNIETGMRVRNLDFLCLSGSSFLLIAVSFAPFTIFGVSRISMIAGLAVVPIFTYLVLSSRYIDKRIMCIVLSLMLVLNSGVFAVFAGERSPQPNLQRDAIEPKDNIEYFHLRSGWATDGEVIASDWLLSHIQKDEKIYAPNGAGGFQSYFSTTEIYTERPPGNVHDLACNTTNPGYLYLNKYAVDTGVARSLSASYTSTIEINTNTSSYDIYYSSGHGKVGWLPKNQRLC
ncbi:DUF2206 domain-containing protein [Haloferax sp. AS1]|uniref:DUF2206 domain-containing protein n=1 Tax=Haloferax sp. AS1 TaxID=2562277 RepID=UPI00165F6A41|nr:DUF2206 domain-containing protein [Haloferax sp. AS1]